MHAAIVGLTSRRRYSLLSGLVFFICFFCLSWQTVRMVGAFYLKGYVDDLRQPVEAYLGRFPDVGASATEIKDGLSREYPALSGYLQEIPFDEIRPGDDASLLVDYVMACVRNELNVYIVWRVVYMLLLAVAFSWLMAKTMKRICLPPHASINWN